MWIAKVLNVRNQGRSKELGNGSGEKPGEAWFQGGNVKSEFVPPPIETDLVPEMGFVVVSSTLRTTNCFELRVRNPTYPPL